MSNLSIILTFVCLVVATNLVLGDDINHVYTPKGSPYIITHTNNYSHLRNSLLIY